MSNEQPTNGAATMTHATPQTVSFFLRLRYLQIERSSDLPAEKGFDFDSFKDMMTFAGKEKRRRALADRATHADYEVKLTDHGREVCDADESRRASHEEMLNKYHAIY